MVRAYTTAQCLTRHEASNASYGKNRTLFFSKVIVEDARLYHIRSDMLHDSVRAEEPDLLICRSADRLNKIRPDTIDTADPCDARRVVFSWLTMGASISGQYRTD